MDDQPIKTNGKDESDAKLAWMLVVILTVLLTVAVGAIIYLIGAQGNEQIDQSQELETTTPAVSPTPTIQPTPVMQEHVLNRTYQFPIKNIRGEAVSALEFEVESYQRTDEVKIAGGVVTTVEGKELLVLNLKLTNRTNNAIMITVRDYLRLNVNEEETWIAPEFHSDPVEVRPQSTKDLRMAFTIRDTDQNLMLQIGGLEEEKDYIELGMEG